LVILDVTWDISRDAMGGERQAGHRLELRLGQVPGVTAAPLVLQPLMGTGV
jgi:hypothetical protein